MFFNRKVNSKNNNQEKNDLSAKFYQTTGLKLIDFQKGILPYKKYRNMSNSMIDIFYNESIEKTKLEELHKIYGQRMILEYLNDLFIKNHSNLIQKGFMTIEDHVNTYSDEQLEQLVNKYFAGQELTDKDNYVLMGLFQKYAELIATYKYNNLLKYQNYIKSELDLGIFENIVVNGKQYKNSQRKKLVQLSSKWGRDTLKKYENLYLLEERLNKLPNTKQTKEDIELIQQLNNMPLKEILKDADKIESQITDLFLNYEIRNREDIINKLYTPQKQDVVVIDDISKLEKGTLLHFFDIYTKPFSFENYLVGLENKQGRKLTEQEKENARKHFQVLINKYIVDKTVSMNAIGETEKGEIYRVNTSNQLSCMVVTMDDIRNMKGIRGNIALGFDKTTITPEQIAVIADKNIHSNKNIDFIESKNVFKEFSCTYDEMLHPEKNVLNTEVVMFRNTDISALKPSYVFYISYRDINSPEEKQNIEIFKEQMQEAGLKVPFVIYDNYSINKKIEQNKIR